MNLRAGCLWTFLLLAALLVSCSTKHSAWPPPPANDRERHMVEAALRAVAQFDGWDQVACVVERHQGQWRVQAWRIVNPNATGRDRCVPWAVRGITLDNSAKVLEYRNHL